MQLQLINAYASTALAIQLYCQHPVSSVQLENVALTVYVQNAQQDPIKIGKDKTIV